MERVYADPKRRMETTNRYLFWGASIISSFDVMVLYFSEGGKYFTNPLMFAYIMTAVVVPIVILLGVLTFGTAIKPERKRLLNLLAVSIIHMFCNSVTNNSAVSCMLFAIAIVCILYYDKRFAIAYGTIVLV